MAFRVYTRDTSGHKFIKKYPFVKKLSPKSTFCDFHVCTIAASVWQTCPYKNNMYFIRKRRQSNVMKKKTIPSIKYICHNKQPKNLQKIMPLNSYSEFELNWIELNWTELNSESANLKLLPTTFIKLQILNFFIVFFFFFIFELKIRVFQQVYDYLILYFPVIFPAYSFCKKLDTICFLEIIMH